MKNIIYVTAFMMMFAGVAKAQEKSLELPENISPEQLQTVFNEAMKAEFNKMDANGDGKISKKEFVDFQIAEARVKGNADFVKLDANNDGNISEEEMLAAMQATMQKIGEQLQNLKAAAQGGAEE